LLGAVSFFWKKNDVMKSIKAFLIAALFSISVATLTTAAPLPAGRWIALSTDGDGYLHAGANLSISKSGKITGKAIYYNGATTRMAGFVRGRKVNMVETASGFRSTWSGTIRTNGKAAVVKANTGVIAYAAKVTASVPEAGVYHGSDSFGHGFVAMVAIDGTTTVYFNDGVGIYMINGRTANGRTTLSRADGSIVATGEIKNGMVTGNGTSGGVGFTFSGQFL
jgi:hypothetical protein